MSVQSIAKVLEHSKAKAGARLVLICIANHDGDGGSWPTVETLSREANLTPRAVQYALTELQSIGELCVHANEGGTKNWRSDRRPNRYEILLDGVQSASPRDVDGVQSAPNGVQSATERGEVGFTQTIQEPSTKPSTSKTSSSPRKRDLLWDALESEIGPARTRSEASRRGGVLKQLREVDATPEEVVRRCRAYKKRWPTATLTDTALVNNWSKFGQPLTEILEGFVADFDEVYR